MKTELSPGDRLIITLEGTDGEFQVLFDHQGDNKVRVLADLPDSTARGGDGNSEIYCERFGRHLDRDKEGNLLSPEEDKIVGVNHCLHSSVVSTKEKTTCSYCHEVI